MEGEISESDSVTKTDLLIQAYEMLHNYEHLLRHPCKAKGAKHAEELIKLIQLRTQIEELLYD